MATLFEGLARFVVRFRVPVTVSWLVIMAAAMLALPSLTPGVPAGANSS